jgi:sugar transferase (PEP-CTERM/EpsH1 system associated)
VEPLLFLSHRIPYPPNKGDKIRSYHTLRHLARRYRIFLGTFVDDEADWTHVETVRAWCTDAYFGRISPRFQKLWSFHGFLTGDALSVAYYRDAALQRWIDAVVAKHGIRKTLAYSSSMAQYVIGRPALKAVLDITDLDSAKWAQYASEHRWPMSAVYRREGRSLLDFEIRVVRQSAAGLFVSVAEANLLLAHAPDVAGKVFGIPNGVDAEYFSRSTQRSNPYRPDELPLVFTGAMDYWPNIDAVCWFANEIMPKILRVHAAAHFYIVGMNPTPSVKALAAHPYVTVTGRVEDVRPYLQHASVFVAPLRLARGIQNKVLEAMAMECQVVASAAALTGVCGDVGREIESATTADDFVRKVVGLLDSGHARNIGRAARTRVLADHDWETRLSGYDAILDAESIAAVRIPGSQPSAAPRLAETVA